MATTRGTSAAGGPRRAKAIDYPTSDGKPMGETDLHRDDMIDVIRTLQEHFAAEPMVYVTGNLLLFYEEGNRRKHVSPDAFVVRGVPKLPPREYYLLWEEGKGPDVVIEITSKSTRREDRTKKLVLYRDVLKVPEYFQFDPRQEYLKPSLQGARLVEGQYVPIAAVEGRLPSEFLGLHLERRGTELRFYNPAAGATLLTQAERAAKEADARQRAEQERQHAEQERRRLEDENERLRRELEALRGTAQDGSR
jgi:Uma2 family endonuclease